MCVIRCIIKNLLSVVLPFSVTFELHAPIAFQVSIPQITAIIAMAILFYVNKKRVPHNSENP